MKKTALLLMIITVLSKVMGFARDMALSHFYGASSITDAYLIAITIPSVIFGFIGTGIATGYIPMYSEQGSLLRKIAYGDSPLVHSKVVR